MTKILYFLFMFLAVPYGAEAAGVFGDDSFILAKSVKLGRSSDAPTTSVLDVRKSSGGNNTISGGGNGRKLCSSDCTDCNMGTGTCNQCQPGFVPSGAGCEICPAGKFSPAGKVCKACPKGSYCDTAGLDVYKSCSSGTYNDTTGNTSCNLCPDGQYQDARGSSSCKTCPSGTYSSPDRTQCYSCQSGYAYRRERDESWTAGCYPIGNCDTLRPDLEGATCMFIDETGSGQCKTDTVWSGTVCNLPCPIPTNATSCSACSYNKTTGKMKCTSAVCKSGYAYREERDGSWAAGCYPIGNCDTLRPDLEGATCMFIDATGSGQCKTDDVWASTVCIVQ